MKNLLSTLQYSIRKLDPHLVNYRDSVQTERIQVTQGRYFQYQKSAVYLASRYPTLWSTFVPTTSTWRRASTLLKGWLHDKGVRVASQARAGGAPTTDTRGAVLYARTASSCDTPEPV